MRWWWWSQQSPPCCPVLLMEDPTPVIHRDGLPVPQPDPGEWKPHFIPAVWLSFSQGGHLSGAQWSGGHST